MADDEADTVEVPKGWNVDEDGKKMGIDVKATDFMGAVALINTVAEIAEDVNHHPDLHLTGYNKLRIETWSHDVGRLTKRDETLALRIDEVLRNQDLI